MQNGARFGAGDTAIYMPGKAAATTLVGGVLKHADLLHSFCRLPVQLS